MKTKIFLQLSLTLLLGFVIGFMSHGYVTSHKIKNYSWGRGESMFWKHALEQVEASPKQIEEIMPIVKRYSEEGHKVMSESYKKVEPIWEEMNKEILPFLTKEQQVKLDKLRQERSQKFKERIKRSNQQRGGQGQSGQQDGSGQNRKDHDGKRNGTPPPPENASKESR